MSDNSGLIVNGLSVHYGQHQALNQVSLNIKPGEIVVILGANGAGKSTLLRTIGGLTTRTGGSLQMNGHPLTTLKAHQIVETGLALVPEGRGIFGDLTVEENLLLGAYAKRARADEQQNLERIYSLFPRLVERRRQIARTMSGGEQQMVAIGRAMMSSPSILMLDEPSLGLSPLLSSDVFKTCKAVRETGVGILLVEQNAKQSLSIADRGYLLENGQIVAENSAQNLLKDPAVQKAYLGGSGTATTAAKPASAPATVKESLAAETAKQSSCSRTIPDRFEMPRVNVAQVLGVSVNEAIRSAEARQKAAWARANQAPLQASSESVSGGGALADMLRRFEQSASQAQRSAARSTDVRASRVDEEQSSEAATDTAATEPSSSTPVLEVYRRVVDDHGRSELALVDKRKV
ncbi:MAG: ATP-binding cassette domain-containing protein [Natronospirillum sp.]